MFNFWKKVTLRKLASISLLNLAKKLFFFFELGNEVYVRKPIFDFL